MKRHNKAMERKAFFRKIGKGFAFKALQKVKIPF